MLNHQEFRQFISQSIHTCDTPSFQQISIHEVRIFEALESAEIWITTAALIAAAGVAARTGRTHVKTWVDLGVVARGDLQPPRYRLALAPPERAAESLGRLRQARAILASVPTPTV